MEEGKIPYLSGCVFYLLLRKAAYTGATARQRMDGIKDNHKNPIFMADLVYAFTGYQTAGSSSDTSLYREGKSEGTVNVPFNDASDIASYDNVVRSRYQDALGRMAEFVRWHLNPDKREWLVKALLDVIENDGGILESDMFCIKADGAFVSKGDLRKEEVFEYEPFLIGVLHYILTKRAGRNHLGIPTLDAITDKAKSKERKYNGHLGEGISRTVTVNFCKNPTSNEGKVDGSAKAADIPLVRGFDDILGKSDGDVINEAAVLSADVGDPTNAQYQDSANEFSAFSTTHSAQKCALTERIIETRRQNESASSTETSGDGETTSSDKDAQEDKKTTIIQQQTNVIQNGGNNVNVTNNGTINFNF